jgi:hypothetical protein
VFSVTVSTSRFLVTASNSGDSSAFAPTPLPARHRLTTELWQSITGGLPPISSSWRQAPWDPRPVFSFSNWIRAVIVFMQHPLSWEDGSVVYNCCWSSPANPVGHMTILYVWDYRLKVKIMLPLTVSLNIVKVSIVIYILDLILYMNMLHWYGSILESLNNCNRFDHNCCLMMVAWRPKHVSIKLSLNIYWSYNYIVVSTETSPYYLLVKHNRATASVV